MHGDEMKWPESREGVSRLAPINMTSRNEGFSNMDK